ncbi:hypothetical protein [Methylocella sp.]|uniref:hypothetical protein n=1 Tax=Methylocella sp. TaxID=1978226 RepID=UPI0035B0E357
MSNTTFFIVVPFNEDGVPALDHVSWHRVRRDAEAEAAEDNELMASDQIAVPPAVVVEVVSKAAQGA